MFQTEVVQKIKTHSVT